MSRSFSFVVASVFLAGAVNAQAHQAARPVSLVSVSAYAGAAAQGDDLAAKVKAALKADADLATASDAVTVTAASGVVTLEGTVPTVQIRAKIGEAVQKVDGVTKLNNKLKLGKK